MPLYGRKMCSEKFPELYTDIFAKNLCDSLDYDFSEKTTIGFQFVNDRKNPDFKSDIRIDRYNSQNQL